MHGKINLTIQDYFKGSGVRGVTPPGTRGGITPADRTGTAFSRALAAAQSDSRSDQRGLTIRDYIARPLTAKRASGASATVCKSDRLVTGSTPSTAKAIDITTKPVQAPSPPSAATPTEKPDRTSAEKNRITAAIDRAAHKYALPEQLLHAVIRAESDFQVRAVSPAGAQGLMQLMPATARELGVRNPFDIDQNIDGGAKYLRSMLDQFGGDIKLALSAYNAGPGNVMKYNGQVPFAETRAYVDRVMRFAGRLA